LRITSKQHSRSARARTTHEIGSPTGVLFSLLRVETLQFAGAADAVDPLVVNHAAQPVAALVIGAVDE
jgi:hypothetical protein